MYNWVVFTLSICAIYGDDQVTVTVNWDKQIGISKTTTTFQACVSPLMSDISPIYDKVYQSITDINADYIRLSFYQNYPSIGVPRIQPPSNKYYCQHLNGNVNNNNWTLTISCPNNYSYSIINDIQFASYGNPSGYCGNLKLGSCNNNNTLSIVKSLCLNKHSCKIPINSETFKYDPCPNITKSFDIQLTCNITDYQYSNWNFSAFMDQIVVNFYNAIDKVNKNGVFNVGSVPNYYYQGVKYGENIMDNPYDPSIKYGTSGTTLSSEAINDIGQYYAKIVSYYKNGGFIDEYGNEYKSDYKLPIKLIEVMNDPDFFHTTSAALYTQIYDATVLNIKNMVNDDDMQFMGLSLRTFDNYSWFEYFLNKENHINNGKDIPIDYISFNFFTGVNNVSDIDSYSSFFNASDEFVDNVKNNVIPIRDKYSPNTKIDIDEIGIGGPANIDNVYNNLWDTAYGAFYAYLFSKLSIIGIDVMGMSTLTGYPDLNYTQFPYPENYPNGIETFSESAAMLNYETGEPNNKYWTVKLLIDNFKIGDKLIETIVSNNGLLHAQGFNDNKVLFINKLNEKITINVNNSNLNNGLLHYIDVDNNGINKMTINGNQFTLNRYGIAVLET